MSLEFNLISSEDYCTYITDGTHGTHTNQETGKYLLSAKDILDGNVHIKDNSRIISEDDFNKIHKNYKLENYDVLLTVAGTIGRTAIIKNYQDNYTFQRSVAIFKTNDKIKSLWLYYYFNSPIGKQIIKSLSKGTTQLILPLKDLRNLEIPVPKNTSDQKKILSILTAIDKKIEINKEINNNLEQLLHTIFSYWFISFEKFGNLKFTQTDLGEIPEGWECGVLSDLLILTKNPIKASETNGLPYLPIDIIPMNSLGISELKSDEEANSSLITFDKNDILIGAMRVYFHRVVISPCRGVTRSTCFVLKPKKEEYLSYLLLLCNLEQTIKYAQNTSKGTTMPYAVWDNGLGDMDIVIPPENVLKEFHQLVFPIIEKIRDSYNEINKLQKLRDTLLPKLMSGEIDVSKINCDLE
ncbi:restriction endonuclease subunit S [uncultured Methanobrevibacter sp.]|uniref:restriction endonuclease subunit S n=1 Tax=uncultured Methanobrevibacter sp. TaxID=253161 RepID=UPI0025ECADB4|nr:restriction endonuclease subunit S [uncultured Methanobrevibacter sp.]